MTPNIELASEATAVSVANKATGAGAAAGMAGFFTNINWLGVTGAFVALAGFAVSVYFQFRRDRRESEYHRERLKALQEGVGFDRT